MHAELIHGHGFKNDNNTVGLLMHRLASPVCRSIDVEASEPQQESRSLSWLSGNSPAPVRTDCG